MATKIVPAEFWEAMVKEGLIQANIICQPPQMDRIC